MSLVSGAEPAAELSPRWRYVIWPLVTAAVYVASAQASQGKPLLALALVAVCVAGAALARPRLAVLALLVLAATVFPQSLLPLAFAGIRTDVVELLALLLVAHALLLTRYREFPLTGPLLLLFGSFITGALVALHNGAQLSSFLGPLKTSALYLLPFVLALHFPDERARDVLETWVIRLAVWSSVLVLGTAAAGMTYFTGRSQIISTLGVETTTARLRPAVLSLVVVAVLLLVARMATHRAGPLAALQLAVLLALVVLSYTRSTLGPLLLAVGLIAVFHTQQRREQRLTRNVLIGVCVLGLLAAAAGSGKLGTPGTAALDRIQSIGDRRLLTDPTYIDRQNENESARRALRDSPIVGVGLAQPYGAERLFYYDNPPRLVKVQRTFIHNSFFGIWLQCGLLGLLALLWLGIRTFRQTRLARAQLPPGQAARCLAGGVGALSFALSSLLQTAIFHRPTILALSLCLYFAMPLRSDGADQDV